MTRYLLAIDQGTTSSRAIVFTETGDIHAVSQQEFMQHYPDSGWVEHDPEAIWTSVVDSCRKVLEKGSLSARDIVAAGITNQRETTIIWDRETGQPIYNAIVWQDRRTAGLCAKLKKQGHEPVFARKTGLLLDPYFSGTKIAWLLGKVKGARRRAAKGELLAGTIDSFLIWRLTGGKAHVTDATNASRTLVYNIEKNEWDAELLKLLDIPAAMLPQVKDCADDFGDLSQFRQTRFHWDSAEICGKGLIFMRLGLLACMSPISCSQNAIRYLLCPLSRTVNPRLFKFRSLLSDLLSKSSSDQPR